MSDTGYMRLEETFDYDKPLTPDQIKEAKQ